MSVFDQRGQHVNYQYNVAGDLNMGEVHNTAQLATQLDRVKEEIARAREGGAIDEDTETEAKYNVTKAAQAARSPEPDKKSLLDYLNAAKGCLEGVAAAGGIVTAIGQAIAAVHGLFA